MRGQRLAFGGANLGWSDQPRLRQPAKEQGRGAAWPRILQVGDLSPGPDGGGRGRRRRESVGRVACDSHTEPSAAAGIDYSWIVPIKIP